MGQKLNEQISSWKSLLLDLSQRNRLLNFRETKLSTVRITSPSCQSIFGSIVNTGKELTFPHKYINGTIETGDVNTSKPVEELNKSLRTLHYRSHAFIEEQGINPLYLIFGILNWKEREDCNDFNAAPLIIVPVKLETEALDEPYRISIEENDIIVNPTLQYKLSSEFNITLPEFDSENTSIEGYLKEVEDIVSKHGWNVEGSVYIALLSFLKINMYKDLEKNLEKLENNEIIQSLVGECMASPLPKDYVGSYKHDSVSPKQIFQVIDADSSQQDAILASKEGYSFVLQGPPGTGKSQTITNIIAEALAANKKILFVSEKAAALQVVHSKLKECGLDGLCLNLHSHKANKKELLAELNKSIEGERKTVREDALEKLSELESYRSLLNEYQEQLHTKIVPSNLSAFDINGELARLHDVPDLIFDINDIDSTTTQKLQETLFAIRHFANSINVNFHPANNVWNTSSIKDVSHELRQNIKTSFPRLANGLITISEILSCCSKEFQLEAPSDIEGLSSLIRTLHIASKSTLADTSWLFEHDVIKLTDRATSIQHLYKQRTDCINQIAGIDFDNAILELDYYPYLQRFRSLHNSIFRYFSKQYRNDIQAIQQYSNRKLHHSDIIRVLRHLHELHEIKGKIEEETPSLQSDLGKYFSGEATDFDKLYSALNFVTEFKENVDVNSLPPVFIQRVFSDSAAIELCKSYHNQLSKIQDSISTIYSWALSLFDDSVKGYSISRLAEFINNCLNNISQLDEWVDYSKCKQECISLGLGSFIKAFESSNIPICELENTYRKRFYSLLLDNVLLSCPAVKGFRGKLQEDNISQFRMLDQHQFKIARARIKAAVTSNWPDFNTWTSTTDEVGILKHEIQKKRRIKPIRRLLMDVPHIITMLRPCFMMSPLSVSIFLEADSYDFDLVIFDEASQIRIQDAIGAIMRGKQVIIAGDTKQLPPTSFFERGINDRIVSGDDEDDNEVFESILDKASCVLNSISLNWHYRSKNEELIAFSNSKIYNNRLITFPSSIAKSNDNGVELIKVSNGIYGRGGNRINPQEAQKVADIVFEHFRKHPERSLGVIAFSEAQQDAIEAAIRSKRMSDKSYEAYFIDKDHEPFFIKNIETVQGDERDTIIFSIGYGKDSVGKMTQNFGALNKEGGERRLNVAVTRAKYNIKVVCSIDSTDIECGDSSPEGRRLLKLYLDYAQNGMKALDQERIFSDRENCESVFEEAVFDFLKSKGYNVRTQIGCSKFRIDMAVIHPNHPGQFAIGIECDGATYHSHRTVRERDRIRQDALEQMGWRIYRIWSTDWINNTEDAKDRLIRAIEGAIANHKTNSCPQLKIEQEIETVVEQTTKDMDNPFGFIPYEKFDIFSVNEFGISTISKIVELEQPIHFHELCQRIAPIYDRQKVTSYVEDVTRDLIRRNGKVTRLDKDYIVTKEFSKQNMKVRNLYADGSCRSIEHISAEEVAMAFIAIISKRIGITKNGLFEEAAEQFGYKRRGNNIMEKFEGAYKLLVSQKKISIQEGKLILTLDNAKQ